MARAKPTRAGGKSSGGFGRESARDTSMLGGGNDRRPSREATTVIGVPARVVMSRLGPILVWGGEPWTTENARSEVSPRGK